MNNIHKLFIGLFIITFVLLPIVVSAAPLIGNPNLNPTPGTGGSSGGTIGAPTPGTGWGGVSGGATPGTGSSGGSGALDALVQKIIKVLNQIIAVLFALATVYFFWGIIEYVIGTYGKTEKLDQGKNHIMWGLIGMAIMLSAWGIAGMIKNFLGV